MKRKTVLIIISAFAVLILGVALLLPTVLKNMAIKNSKEWVGRQIDIKKLKVNYFTGTVQLYDFRLFEKEDSSVFVKFDTLIVDTEPYRLINNEFIIERLYLSGFDINVIMYDSSFNFDDLIAYHKSDVEEAESDSVSSGPLQFELSNLELSHSYATLKDAVIDRQMEINNLNFFVPYIAWNQEDRSQAGLKFNFKNGGYFQSDIDMDPVGGDFDVELILENMDISGYTDFVKKYLDIGSFQGITDLDLKIKGNMNDPEKSLLSGFVNLRDFDLKDHDQNPLLAVQDLRVKLEEIDPSGMRLLIDSISMTQPYVYFEMYDSTNNIMEALNRSLPQKDASTDTLENADPSGENAEPDLFYSIRSFEIQDGMIDLVDRRTGDPFQYHLSEMKMSVDSIASTASWIDTYAQMILNNRGKLVAGLGINPSDPMNLILDYTITDFMLSDLNIYSRHYMGFPILYGDMYYKGHSELSDGQLQSENKLIIHNVELGNKSSGIYDLPLKFALFLLKDKDGVINLDVPVRGDLKDPKISVGKIIWNTFKNLIIKAAAAPVKLLSGLIGADPEDIESIEYEFLDTAFNEHRARQIDLLLQLEQEKKDLEIELIYFNDPLLEKQELILSEAGRIYQQKSNKDYREHEEDFESFVREETNSDSLELLAACHLLVDETHIDSLYTLYNEKRISDLQGYLKMKNDSSEIMILAAKPEAPKNVNSKPRFEVKYGMKEEHIESSLQ